MKHDDAKILQEIQRNTEMGMTAIETILDKIEDDDFSLQLSKQSLRYSEIHNKALDQIEQRRYEEMLVEKGVPKERIRKYGFAFCGKKVLILRC